MENAVKKSIRDKILYVRDALPERERRQMSLRITENLLRLPVYCRARHVLCYVNYKSEAETRELIAQCLAEGKRLYCPLVSGRDMEFYEIVSVGELRRGFHGICEPQARDERLFLPYGKEEDTLIIMPGAAFDRAHHRIGYGGGYYDRYLQRASAVPTAALAFSCQILEEIPFENHDICPQVIVTEEGVL